jgi:hypothetical protein
VAVLNPLEARTVVATFATDGDLIESGFPGAGDHTNRCSHRAALTESLGSSHEPNTQAPQLRNVVATLALLFAMSGGALAAKHCLINSTKQINPKILKKLKGSAGSVGAVGPRGARPARRAYRARQARRGPRGDPVNKAQPGRR